MFVIHKPVKCDAFVLWFVYDLALKFFMFKTGWRFYGIELCMVLLKARKKDEKRVAVYFFQSQSSVRGTVNCMFTNEASTKKKHFKNVFSFVVTYLMRSTLIHK